jgi:hypothetical protein
MTDFNFNWFFGNKEFLAIVVGFVGTVFTIRQQTSVMQTQVALEFFRRHSEITDRMPDRLRLAKYATGVDPVSEKERRAILRSMIQYCNLCSEEFALHAQKRVPDDVWRIWINGIQENFQTSIWRELWSEVSREYVSYVPFFEFMNEVVARATNNSPTENPES